MQAQSHVPSNRAVRPAQAAARLGISQPTLWRWARNLAGFPKPTKLGPRVTVFFESDLDAYLETVRARGAK